MRFDNKMTKILNHLGGTHLASSDDSEVTYPVYNKISQYYYYERVKKLEKKEDLFGEEYIKSFKDSMFCKFDDPKHTKKARESLSTVFEHIQQEWDDPSPLINRNDLKGFGVYEGPSMKNITYVSRFSEESLLGIKKYLETTNIKELLEEYFQSSIGVCNVRAYRFTDKPDEKNTHFEENFDTCTDINPHHDGLPYRGGKSIKIMIFKDGAGSESPITIDHGALEVNIKNNWVPIVGGAYVCAIFEPNFLLHRAFCPKPGFKRDAVELTVIPKIEQGLPVIAAGAHSGCPINPFKNWSNFND